MPSGQITETGGVKHTVRSLSARKHPSTDEESAGRDAPRRIAVKSLAAGRQIRGVSVWSCPQPLTGPLPPTSPRRRPGTAPGPLALTSPGDVISELQAPVTLTRGPKQPTAPRPDGRGERPMSLFSSPAREKWMRGSLESPQGSCLSSRPHTSHTLPRRLPSMQSDDSTSFPGADPLTPRQRLFVHAGSDSSGDEAAMNGTSTGNVAGRSDGAEIDAVRSTSDVGGRGASNEFSYLYTTSSWSLSGSDEEDLNAPHRPSTASLGEISYTQCQMTR
jgi:hypothetical protein